MDCKVITLNHNKLLLGKYLKEIKESIKLIEKNTEDLGSIFIINFNNYFITINELYVLNIYYKDILQEDLQNINIKIHKFENIIQGKFKDFSFDKSILI